MKKCTAIWLAILMLFCAAASSCGLSADEPSEKVGVARLVTTEYPVQISRTPHVTGSYAPEISVIRRLRSRAMAQASAAAVAPS